MSPKAPRPSEVSSDDVRFLLAVARSGRMISAATLLGVDHTTVKRRIDRLETALGAKLLDRGADGWVLTPAGRDVVAEAASLEAVMERVVGAVSSEDARVYGTVRIAAPEGFSTYFAAPALARVGVAHPGITTELVTSTRPVSVRGSGYDLTVSVGSGHRASAHTDLLAPYLLRLYASRQYLAEHPPARSIDDLDQHRLVFYVDALLTVHELDLPPVLRGVRVGFGSTSVFAQAEATRRGAGIGLLHAFMAERDPDLVRVLPEVEFPLHFALTARREGPSVEAVALVRAELEAEVAARAGEMLGR
jgi:DNA-binding transcriptional LysR family regulator